MKLDAFEKDNIIAILELVTRFSREYLKSLDDAALDRLYKERVG